MGTVTEIETDEQRAARLEQEQEALDAAEETGPAGDGLEPDEPSLREQVDAAHEAAGTSPEPDAIESVLQGTIDGGWEQLVGGKEPTGLQIRFVGGAIYVDPPAGGFRKGQTLKFEVTARLGGFAADDTVDSETQQAIDCKVTYKARVQGGRVVELVEDVGA